MTGLLRLFFALTLLPAGIPGKYEACWLKGLLCSAVVDIRADGTFLISIDDAPPMPGTWKLLDNGLLSAGTLEQARPAAIKVERRGSSGYLTICVTDDTNGEPISHVEVFVDAGSFSYTDLTNSHGCVRAVRTMVQGFSTSHYLFETAHEDLPGKNATRVRVRLPRKRPHFTDELWLLSGDKLYRLSGEPLTRNTNASD